MKVLCIVRPTKLSTVAPIVEVGEVYTVINSGQPTQVKGNMYIDAWYELSEHIGVIYSRTLFIPLSDIDETEMVRNYQTEKV